jgi:hypothetical protein
MQPEGQRFSCKQSPSTEQLASAGLLVSFAAAQHLRKSKAACNMSTLQGLALF